MTNDAKLAARARSLREHGSTQRYYHDEVGFNYRMEGIQGAVLGVKLGHLDAWTAARRANAAAYHEALAGSGVVVPKERPGARHVYHLYVVRSEDRDGLQAALQARGIQTGLHYPIPVHLQEAHRDLGYLRGQFPHAEAAADDVLSLPMFPELTRAQIGEVADAVREHECAVLE